MMVNLVSLVAFCCYLMRVKCECCSVLAVLGRKSHIGKMMSDHKLTCSPSPNHASGIIWEGKANVHFCFPKVH